MWPFFAVQSGPHSPNWDFEAEQTIPDASDGTNTAIGSSSLAAQSQYISWQEFFACCEARNQEKLACEGPKECQIRLSQAAQLLTRRTRVNEWTRGNHLGDDCLYQKLIPQKLHEEFFEMYSATQSRYDAFNDKWNLCEEFGPGKSDLDMSEDGFDALQDLEANAPTENSIPNTRPASPTMFDNPHAWNLRFPELNTPLSRPSCSASGSSTL